MSPPYSGDWDRINYIIVLSHADAQQKETCTNISPAIRMVRGVSASRSWSGRSCSSGSKPEQAFPSVRTRTDQKFFSTCRSTSSADTWGEIIPTKRWNTKYENSMIFSRRSSLTSAGIPCFQASRKISSDSLGFVSWWKQGNITRSQDYVRSCNARTKWIQVANGDIRKQNCLHCWDEDIVYARMKIRERKWSSDVHEWRNDWEAVSRVCSVKIQSRWRCRVPAVRRKDPRSFTVASYWGCLIDA